MTEHSQFPAAPDTAGVSAQQPVLVVDMGAQYAQLIARRVREAGVYSEVVPHFAATADIVAKDPRGIIITGGPASVYAPDATAVAADVFDLEVPVLGVCYGFQLMASHLGGTVSNTGEREYGSTEVDVTEPGALLQGSPATQTVWMSHGDAVTSAPDGFQTLAKSAGAPIAAFEDPSRGFYGVQWHPEVHHTTLGQHVFDNFLTATGQGRNWTPESVVAEQIAAIRTQVGTSRVICALSGGVDSSVAAALVQQAVGDQLTCVFVDHGLLRTGEARQVQEDFVTATGVDLRVVDASAQFLEALAGVSDPETKRKIIGREFIRTFETAAADIVAESHPDDADPVRFLVQGTLYPDVVESGGGDGSATIKSHHNVGGLPEDLQFDLVEPLRLLFKDEVRAVGLELGVPEAIVWRQPFPGPGLGIRIIGEVTAERLEILRAADFIAREEMTKAGLDRSVWQCPVVLLADVHSVGVQGDGRTYGHPIVLRPVTSEDAMTADWARVPYEVLSKISTRITNQVPDINRVVLDVTSKPPGTIEWE